MIDNNSNITVECGDCLDLMAGIPDGSIKAVIADPPYYQGLTHNGQKGSLQI